MNIPQPRTYNGAVPDLTGADGMLDRDFLYEEVEDQIAELDLPDMEDE